MAWTTERKRDAAIEAPLHVPLRRPDSRIVERPGWYQIVTPSAPGTLLNEVVLSRVEPDEAERAIDEVVATHREIGHPVKWCVGPWTKPEDFGERLQRRGFSSWDVRGMAVDTAHVIRSPEAVAVAEVTEQSLDDYVAASMRGWSIGPDQFAAELDVHRTALRSRPRTAHFFAATIGDHIVGTTGLFTKGDHAYLVGAQVMAPFRGRGIYRALVAARLAFLAREDIAVAVTHAREATSAPILERLGFETVFRSKCFLLDATATRQGADVPVLGP